MRLVEKKVQQQCARESMVVASAATAELMREDEDEGAEAGIEVAKGEGVG